MPLSPFSKIGNVYSLRVNLGAIERGDALALLATARLSVPEDAQFLISIDITDQPVCEYTEASLKKLLQVAEMKDIRTTQIDQYLMAQARV